MSCLVVSVYNVHSGFRLRSIVTAHMNVLPGKVQVQDILLETLILKEAIVNQLPTPKQGDHKAHQTLL